MIMVGGRKPRRQTSLSPVVELGVVTKDDLVRRVADNTASIESITVEEDIWIPSGVRGPVDVTVILRAYREPQSWVDQAIESVRAQGVSAEIILVVDGGGTEYSISTAPDIAYYRCSSNRGCGYSRIISQRYARGRYIRVLDADDLLPHGALRAQMSLMSDTIKLVFGDLTPIGPDGKPLGGVWEQTKLFKSRWDRTSVGMRELLLDSHTTVVPGPSAMWDRAWAYGTEYSPDWSYVEDGAWYRSLLVNSRHDNCVSWCDQSVLLYRLHDSSMTGRGGSVVSTVRRSLMESRGKASKRYGDYCKILKSSPRKSIIFADHGDLCCGGAQWSIMQLMSHLDRRIFDVRMMTWSAAQPPTEWLRRRGIYVDHPSSPADINEWMSLYLDKFSPDMINYVWNVWRHNQMVRSKVKFSAAHMQSSALYFSGVEDRLDLFDGFVCVSDAVRAAMPSSSAKLKVIQSPVDVVALRNSFPSREAVRAALGYKKDDIVVLWAGRVLGQEKRPDLMRALAEETRGKLKFLIAGSVGDTISTANQIRAEWQSWSQRMGVRWYDGLWPWQVYQLHLASDIILNTSDIEGQSLALLEGMGSGSVAVATDVGGAREAVIDGVTGQVVRKGSFEELLDALELYAQMGRDELRERGELASQKMLAEFDVREHARQYSLTAMEWLS